MSYWGLRKVKFLYDEENKWHIQCDVYDSSIWTWDNKRAWSLNKKCYTGFETREELEKVIFLDTLNGNIRGVGGKFSSASWVKGRKFELTTEQKQILDELDKKTQEKRQAWLKMRDMENRDENLYRQLKDEESNIRRQKHQLYEDFCYKQWLIYTKEKNKNKTRYIVQLDFHHEKRGMYRDIFVSNTLSTCTKFEYYISGAKLFTENYKKLIDRYVNNPDYSNVRIYAVTDEDLTKVSSRKKVCRKSASTLKDERKLIFDSGVNSSLVA